MIGALVLALAADAVLIAERPQVELGEPFEVRVEVDHAHGTVVRVGELPWDLDRGWLLFDAGAPVASERSDGSGLVTTARFHLAAIEQTAIETEEGWTWSATRELPAPPLTLVSGADETAIECAPATILALSVLGVGEDVPRAFPDHLEPVPGPTELELWQRAGLVVGLAALVLGWAWLVLLRQRGRGDSGPVERSLGERRRDVDGVLRGGAPPRELVFELTALVRDSVDELQSTSRRGLTDVEWLATLPRHDDFAPLRERLAEFLARSARAKYSGHEPTGWAVEELAREGLGLLEAVAAWVPRADGADRRLGGAA